MWWLDPGKEVLNLIFNRLLAPYVENLNMNQVSYGIAQGELSLRNLRMKKGALDKFRLPVDVLEGYLGKFSMNFHWRNLGNTPAQITIEDVYLLVVSSAQTTSSPEDDERREYEMKLEKLENAEELLQFRPQSEEQQENQQRDQGLVASIAAKILNNLQITVKNIHVRFEDKQSCPGHPFAAGLTLAGFTAISTDKDWVQTFIESTAGSIHKLATLESLTVYFDTDTGSLEGLPLPAFIEAFSGMIATGAYTPNHQFMLKPVTGEGRVVMNHVLKNNDIPHIDVQLLFDEIAFVLDKHQYRDAVSVVDMFHFYARKLQYRKYRPNQDVIDRHRGKGLWSFARDAILHDVHENARRWSWAYFKERRDDRLNYVDLFQRKLMNCLSPTEPALLEALERKLSYDDIRFYRSISRSRLKKDLAIRRKVEEERQKAQQPRTWTGWLWGSAASTTETEPQPFSGEMSEQQRRELYTALDFDESTALAESLSVSKETLKARVAATLKRGSLALRSSPNDSEKDLTSLVFDVFRADVLQRQDNFEASISLGDLRVYDGTTPNTLYDQIVRVKDAATPSTKGAKSSVIPEPFFSMTFEHNPLDERANNALTTYMRSMEILYHRGYVEAIYRFFKPPESQLQSMEALLSAASETLEGLRKETRAGLEYALQTHKTIDIRMDMHAPIIIIPESVLLEDSRFLVVDAGQIYIESKLAEKSTLREVHLKRNQKYTEDDYRRLESLMYDRFSVRLSSAQFVLADSLLSCRRALQSQDQDRELHLIEPINIDLMVQMSIVPTVRSLTRLKVSGKLPTLHVNFSDSHYKAIMSLVDVAIPQFDDQTGDETRVGNAGQRGFQLSKGIFSQPGMDYSLDDDADDEETSTKVNQSSDETYFETEDGIAGLHDIRQNIIEFNFEVSSLQATLSKSTDHGTDGPLGTIRLEKFALAFANTEHEMKVDINLRSLSMDIPRDGTDPLPFISSPQLGVAPDQKLMTIAYSRVQPSSPDFAILHEGIGQDVDIKLSTMVFCAAPEPILALYDFIMTTFAPNNGPSSNALSVARPSLPETESIEAKSNPKVPPPQETSKIRVMVKLDGVQVILTNSRSRIATVSLSTADVVVMLLNSTLQVSSRIGELSITDDSSIDAIAPEFKKILSIEGGEFAEFSYETFEPGSKEAMDGALTSVRFRAGSLKVHFLEEPLNSIYSFLTKLAKLKGLYDAATQAAAQKAAEMDRMSFDISVKTPILVFPSDVRRSKNVLTMRLGEIASRNRFKDNAQHISSSLKGVQLTSTTFDPQQKIMKIVDDVNITTEVIQHLGIDRQKDLESIDNEIAVQISDVKVHVTQLQYCWLVTLSQSIPRVFTVDQEDVPRPAEQAVVVSSSTPRTGGERSGPAEDSEPGKPYTALDLVVKINAVQLHLYDELTLCEDDRDQHGITRFALNGSNLRLKLLSNHELNTEFCIKSFTVYNTRVGQSKFREIIPAAPDGKNQIMIIYNASAVSSTAVVTIDSPKFIFAVDPVFSMLKFFMSPFRTMMTQTNDNVASSSELDPDRPSMNFRVDLHDMSICVLEDDNESETQAILLSVHRIFLSQQRILTFTINQLGMSLMSMGKQSDRVRFLDDMDILLAVDSPEQSLNNIEVTTKPIVLRASYRDITLITTIANKAVDLFSKWNADTPVGTEAEASPTMKRVQLKDVPQPQRRSSTKLLISKEDLKATFDGFRLVLISDIHETPVVHLQTKPFVVSVKDWSAELRASTTVATSISYWNLKNSHWEPLIDPWTFSIMASKETSTSGYAVTLTSQERLDLNLSTTLVELALSAASTWSKEGESVLRLARGSYAPYSIKNRTGGSVSVWSEIESSGNQKEPEVVEIPHGQSVEWRFDDWKSTREHVSTGGYNCIGIRFGGKPWDPLRNIPVDREGEYIFSLRSKSQKVAHRLMCEITIENNTKVVTLRSTYKLDNQTLYPLEVTLIDESGLPVYAVEKLAPAQDFCLPFEAVTKNRIRIQPDQGFGYKWSPPIRWEDLMNHRNSKGLTIRCPHTIPSEAPFRFQVWPHKDAGTSDYPNLSLRLRAPIELENLLPFNIQYKIYDKNTDQNWSSYLRKGGVMPVHSVELEHLVLLSVTVQDTGYKPSDFAIINTDGKSDFDVENQLSIRDSQDRVLNLGLNYVRYPDSGGAFRAQIFSPYIVLNKTGLPYNMRFVRSGRTTASNDVAGDSTPESTTRTTPFLVSHPNTKSHEFVFRLSNSSWSKAINFEASSAETAVVLTTASQKSELHIGLSWTEGSGKYKLSKIITLAPRFVVKNNLSEAIYFREHGVGLGDRAELSPNSRAPLISTRVGQEKLLTLAYPGLDAQWSPPFNIEDIGIVHVRMRMPGATQNDSTHLIVADIAIEGATIFVTLTKENGSWPFTIENKSVHEIWFGQSDEARERPNTSAMFNLKSHTKMQYAWDYPASREKRIYLWSSGQARHIDIMEIGVLPPVKFHQSSKAISLDVRAEGNTQVLTITDYKEEMSIYKLKRRSTSTSVTPRRESSTLSSLDFEAVQAETPPNITLIVDVAGFGLSLVNKRLVEVAYLTVNNLKLEYSNSSAAQSIILTCGVVQVDNQLHDAQFPVVLQPSPLAREARSAGSLPTVQASLIVLNDSAHGVLFVKYASILLQAITVQIDEAFLFAVLDLTKFQGVLWEAEPDNILIAHPVDLPEPKSVQGGQDVYFEVLELQPIILSVSFVRNIAPTDDDNQKLKTGNPFAVVLNALTMALGNLGDARLELNALGLKDVRLTLPDIQSRIIYHYRQEVLRQVYRLLGSADFLGNPVGLFTNVSSGVADIFYEPWRGVVMHGNKELGIGIAKGAASFVKKTVFGVSDSMTKVTSSLGKGLSAATLDSEYQAKRRLNQRKNKPRHAIYGVTAGAEALASSVASGVEGVVMKPIEGAEAEGAVGFFKGMGKGLIGAFTKPVVGVFDLASNVTEGIRNTTTVFDNPERERVRKPRLVPADGVLRPYSAREALGQEWMRDLEDGEYRKEHYVTHLSVNGDDNIALLTTNRILSFRTTKLRLEWDLPFTRVEGVSIEDNGIRFAIKGDVTKDRFIVIQDKSSQKWFFDAIASVVKKLNSQRRNR